MAIIETDKIIIDSMKHILKLLTAVAVILLVACACEKEGVQRFKGNYTFKTGGTLTVKTLAAADEPDEPAEPENPADEPAGYEGQTGPEEPSANDGEPEEELSTVPIVSESGQMDIIVADKTSGDMIVTMNILGGTVVTFNVTADGKTLNIIPFRRQVTLSPANYSADALRPAADVEISGYGERYDNIIIFRMEYRGNYTFAGKEYEIVGSSIDCVAKQNNN